MKCRPCVRALTLIASMGVIFSGYLSATKLLSDTCAFGETCPYFLGYPACYYGFFLFFSLFVTGFLMLTGKFAEHRGALIFNAIATLGIVFAGYFTILELPTLFEKGLSQYVLGLPTCALGLLFFIACWLISLTVAVKTAHP